MADTTYPLALPALQLLVGGIDYTAVVMAKTLTVHQILGQQVDTCAFSVKSPESWRAAAVAKPTVGQSVAVSVQTGTGGAFVRVFTGQISNVGETRIANRTVRWDVDCVDNSHVLRRNLVIRNYQILLVSDIVLDLVARYAPGVDTSNVSATANRTVQSLTFSYITVMDALTQLAQLVSYQWFLDPNGALWFYDPLNVAIRQSPNSVTDTSQNYNELFIEPQLDQVRNRIYVQGGSTLSDTIQETFDCDGQNNGIGDTFRLSHRNIVSTQIGTIPGGLTGQFFTLNGVPQTTLEQGVSNADESSLVPGGWLVDVTNGIVSRSPTTPIPADRAHAVFQYQFSVPVNVMRQDTNSIATVAALEGTDWITTVSGDNPKYWWPLGESNLSTFAVAGNRGWASALGSAYTATYSGGVTQAVGPLIAPANTAAHFGGIDGRVIAQSGVRIQSSQYSLEALVLAGTQANRGIISQYDSTTLGGVVLYIDTFNNYELAHRRGGVDNTLANLFTSVAPTATVYDHVVATYSGTSALLYVNNQLLGSGSLLAPTNNNVAGGVEIGDYDYTTGTHFAAASIAHAAIYDYALSAQQVADHYFSFRYGGVREQAVTQNGTTSFDAARQIAYAQLLKYSAVLTHLRWSSFVSGWQAGDTVTINVTSANTGRTFSGTALIQEVQMKWLGAQRVEYTVDCNATRYHPMDHAVVIAAPNTPIIPNAPVGGLTLIAPLGTDKALLIDGTVGVTLANPPFFVQPDFGNISSTPVITVGQWI